MKLALRLGKRADEDDADADAAAAAWWSDEAESDEADGGRRRAYAVHVSAQALELGGAGRPTTRDEAPDGACDAEADVAFALALAVALRPSVDLVRKAARKPKIDASTPPPPPPLVLGGALECELEWSEMGAPPCAAAVAARGEVVV